MIFEEEEDSKKKKEKKTKKSKKRETSPAFFFFFFVSMEKISPVSCPVSFLDFIFVRFFSNNETKHY